MKNKFIFKTRILIEYYLVLLIYLLLLSLPINVVSFLGSFIFQKIGPYTKTQKIVKKNLLQIFPKLIPKEIKKESKKSWSNTGKIFFELLVLSKIVNKKNNIRIEGQNYINKIISNKEKVIFIGIHQSNWEILLPSIDNLGIPVIGVYRHINNPYINKLILEIRKKSIFTGKSFYTPKGKKSAQDILEGIKKNMSIVLLIDQKDSGGELIDFFNYQSKTQIGFIKIARKYNMKIVPVENIRDKNNNFILKFHRPIESTQKISDKELMTNIHQIIEKWISENPSNWFLQHNRFN